MNKQDVSAMYSGEGGGTEPEYRELLAYVQERIAKNEAYLLTGTGDEEEVKRLQMEAIQKHLAGCPLPQGTSMEQLVKKLYDDMASCSFLNEWLETPGVEEININRWDDVTITMSGRKPQKLQEHFTSPQHAVDVLRRLLQKQNISLNSAQPSVVSYLTDSIRIAANIPPVVSKEAAVNASIRIVRPSTVTREVLLEFGSCTEEMLDFLTACVRHRISICISGGTGAGKTALLGYLLGHVPEEDRLITIEEGSREFNLVRRDGTGAVKNNIVSFATDEGTGINQEKLLEVSLRENPDYVAVGEMRSVEAYTATEAARTGAATYTTTHADNARDTYLRIMELSYKKYPYPVEFLLLQMVKSFPVVVYMEQYRDGSRKISEILEGEVIESESLLGGEAQIHSLWNYQVEENVVDAVTGNVIEVKGKHVKRQRISNGLRERFLAHGATKETIERLTKGVKP